jgi:nucleoside-diphosphate-sugar epimerase
MTVPSTLEEISLLPHDQGTNALLPLNFVAFGGGPLKRSVGERLAEAGVRLLNHYGATEIGPLAPIFSPPPDYNWHYFRLRKDYDLRLESVAAAEDGLPQYKLVARPFGWDTTFEVQDRLVSDPNNPGLDFNAVGRKDDLIVLATGEKVHPGILESSLSECDLVKSAIAFGENQFEVGVIIEPVNPLPSDQGDRFKSSIWPVILKACNQMDAHARVTSKDAIIIVPTGMLVPRSDKGSIMRKEVYKVFQAQIERAYQDLEYSIVDLPLPPLSMTDLEIELKALIQSRLDWKVFEDDWNYDDDFFELGMDSLQAVRLRRFLLTSLPKSLDSVPVSERIGRDFVYKFPSISTMARALRDNGGANCLSADGNDEIDAFVERYSVKGASPPNGSMHEKPLVVLLTGSTGSLGSHILANLTRLPSVSKVICLNRPYSFLGTKQDPYKRQADVINAAGIKISKQDWSKIQIIQTNTASLLLGLHESDYGSLRGQITHILHNAWPMDFKRKLPSFKAQFQTLHNLISLARDAHAMYPLIRPRILFISSIAVVGQYPAVHRRVIVPEISMTDKRCTNPFGYGEAKLVCERIMEAARQDYPQELQVSYVRVGQLSGSQETGFWNTREHIPALIKSSQMIGRLPKIEGVSFLNYSSS